MIHVLNLLNEAQVKEIRRLIDEVPEARWVDGTKTAWSSIRNRKRNKQLVPPPPEVAKLVHDAMVGNAHFNALFNAIAMPKVLTALMISRYAEGDGYGAHMDAALGQNFRRNDLSMSVCLSSLDEFEGGEMVFACGSVSTTVRPEAGQAVLFDTNLEHSVTPIRKGVRHVAITFIESAVHDPICREISFRLGRAMRLAEDVQGPVREELISCIAYAQENCLRKWARS